MHIHHLGSRIRGFSRIAQFGHLWSMTPNDAQHRLQILEFWATHGAAATHDAYQVSRRTLYRWKQTVTQAGGNPAALDALCHLLPVPPRYVLSDNGSAFLGHFQHRLEKRGITHWWTYPRSPKMNAHAERFNRTLQEQFVDYHEDLLFDDLADFNRKLADWLLFYNTERPHHSLRLHSPVQFLIQHQPECQRWWTHTTSCMS